MKLPLRSPIARVSALNLAGAVTPAILGILLLPAITSGLGLERFGLLSIALVTLEYASLFALGLGPATTRYVAEDVARGGATSLSLIRWSVLAQAVLGCVGAAVLFMLAPFIAIQAFDLAGVLAADAIAAFRLVGLLLPVTLVFTNLLGALEGARRFDYSNGLRIPAASATFLIPAITLYWSRSVPLIIALLIVVRLLLIVFAWLLVRRALPGTGRSIGPGALRKLFTFGAWVSVSNFASPVLVYGERYMLVARSGVAAAGLYSAPLDALLRVLLVPGSLVRALFPVLTAAESRQDLPELRRLFAAAVRWVAVLVGPPLLAVALLAPSLLQAWLGPAFAAGAGEATRVLALGVLLNSMAQVPASFLVATGKPQIPARFHLAQMVFYVPLAWWLVGRFGIIGAAWAWTLRVAVDSGLLYTAVLRSLRRAPSA
ncbi:MAG TPA: flippase [Gemmatimonadaceae bacterium]|nr:flippase [Gemmatimonadaceae bacterium]